MLDNNKKNINIEKTSINFISSTITHIIKILKQTFLNSDYINYNLDDILKDYYELLKINIKLEKNITYLFHIISTKIKNSTEENDKKLIMILIPEFYTPFKFQISLTYPYLSRVLTTIQNNINSNINPIFISEIFLKILNNIFQNNLENYVNKNHEICQGFCIYNMKQNGIQNQLVGVTCLNKLISENNYYLNIERYIKYLWEKIIAFIDNENFTPKNILLKCLSNLILKCKLLFKPYINKTINKLLNFLENKDCEIRKESLNVLLILVTYCPDEMIKFKSLLINYLKILQKDEMQHIRINSALILKKIKGNSKSNNNIKSYNNKFFNDINKINNKKKCFFNYILKNNSTYSNSIRHTNTQPNSVNKNLKNQKNSTHKNKYFCYSENNFHKKRKQHIKKEFIFNTEKNNNFFINFSKGIFIKDNYRTFTDGVECANNELKEGNQKYNTFPNNDNAINNNSAKKNNYYNKELNICVKNNKKDYRLNDILNQLKKMDDRQIILVKAFERLKNELHESITSLKTRINNLEFLLDNNKNNN